MEKENFLIATPKIPHFFLEMCKWGGGEKFAIRLICFKCDIYIFKKKSALERLEKVYARKQTMILK